MSDDDYSWENDDSSGDERTDALFNMLVEEGALVLTGMSESGEPTYAVTEKCREVMPDLYEQMKMDFNTVLTELWTWGIIDYNIAETSDDDQMRLSDNWFENLREVVSKTPSPFGMNHRMVVRGLIDAEVNNKDEIDWTLDPYKEL